jgi:hypothetical protein
MYPARLVNPPGSGRCNFDRRTFRGIIESLETRLHRRRLHPRPTGARVVSTP